jgi:uncharacterized protein (TIGR01319 family)
LDVTKGIINAIRLIEAKNNKKILIEEKPSQSINLLCSSSASGGLHMIITGLTKSISGESAQRAALGAGAFLIDLFCKDDGRSNYEKVNILRTLKPDLLLMSGGTDGGATKQIIEMAKIIKDSDIKPRFGVEYLLPLIFAGNVLIQKNIQDILNENNFSLKNVEAYDQP